MLNCKLASVVAMFLPLIMTLLPSWAYAAPFRNNYISIDNNIDMNVYVGLASKGGGAYVNGTDANDNAGSILRAYASIACSGVTCPSDGNREIWDNSTNLTLPFTGPVCRSKGGAAICDGQTYLGTYPKSYYTVFDKGIRFMPKGLNMNDMMQANDLYISNDYLRRLVNIPTGSSTSISQSICFWPSNIVLGENERCEKSRHSTFMNTNTLSYSKIGHLHLKPLTVRNTIMVDSTGAPKLAPGSQQCEYRGKGIVCEMVHFEANFTNVTHHALKIALHNSIAAQVPRGDLSWSLDKTTYFDTTLKGSLDSLENKNVIYVYLGPGYFKALVNSGLAGTNIDGFNFTIEQLGALGLSGVYRFFPSMKNDVLSRNYSVSIKPSDGSSHLFAEGSVGKDMLTFNYDLIESGPKSATKLLLRIGQDTGTPFNGLCTFYQEERAIPVPTNLKFNSSLYGAGYSQPVRCDRTPTDIRTLGITDSHPAEHWEDADGSGLTRFYQLGLEFNLRSSMTQRTVGGEPWEGMAHQTGTIEFTAIWE
ncbi:hypothetical protein O4H51_22290 [Aeromonas hydrophila]|uniref:hypothetical protein n=1 Tax=Aeromonas hydrophila TaxID=644 RepID=UPI0022AF98F2|nr:hypothetical protein [Aeromonas hydrophila]MCZ4335576.1 hypothetical protein [Aeromonas hydrophila]